MVPVIMRPDMAGPHAATRAVLTTVAILLAGHGLSADSIELPVPEAPTTIFSAKLGSVDVDLSLLGSWTTTASVGGYLLFAPGAPLKAGVDDSSPIPNAPWVTNIPDITVSLELLKHFFLSASIIGSFANNYIQGGYRGGPGDALRSVIIGTQGITIPASTLMQIPGQPQGSLGVMSELVSFGSTNDFLLRWDATLPKRKTFVGRNELVEQEIGINEYIRGMYFYLPDTGLDTGTLQVFLEDPSGTVLSADGRKYRLATYNEVVLDSANGLVSLKNAVKGRVLVYYTKGSPVGATSTGVLPKDNSPSLPPRDPTLSQSFNWNLSQSYPTYLGLDMTHRKVPLADGRNALLLWEPGDNSPFEIESSYAFSSHPPSDVSKISIRLNAKDSTALPTTKTFIFLPDPPNNRFSVLLSQNYRSFPNFYPFDDPTGLVYGPNHDSVSGYLDYDLVVQMMTPVSDFVLEANIEPGSVQVTVNGMPETRFEVEPVSGRLTPHFDILPTDRIEVTYRKAEAGISGGDILFAWKNQIPLSDRTDLSLSAGVRWNANPWTFSQTPYSKSGTVIATAGIDGRTDNLQYSAQAGVSYTNPDTTGILRLFGMEGNSTQLDLSEDAAYPASAPGLEIAPGLTQATRGILYYRDYRNYDKNFNVLSLDNIEASPHPQMPFADGNRMGPYNVTGSDGNLNATSLVFEYSLTASQWVGAQVPVSPGSDVDLSNARAITVRLRAGTGPLTQSGAVSVYLQVGSISEDLDGSGVLKAESTPVDTGFPFVQVSPPVTLKVGAGPRLQGNGKLDTEDRNANGILDQEDPNRVVTASSSQFPIPIASLNASWQNFTYALSDADRQKLLQARGVRIIIVESTGTASAQGDVLIDSVTIEGTPFWTTTTERGKVQVEETSENLAQATPAGSDFAGSFPSTYRRFHPNGETNQVLETVWNSVTAPFSVRGFMSQGTGGIQYQTAVAYVRSSTSLAAAYTFKMLDSSSRGIAWNVSIPAGDNRWHEVKVSRKDNTVTVDGANQGAPIQFDSNYGSLVQFQVAVAASPASGYLYIDEIYLTDPQSVVGAAFVGSLSAKFPGTILAAGKTTILSNVALRQDVDLYSGGFAALYGTPYAAEDLSSRSHLDADLFFVRTSLDLALRDQGGSLSASGGHRVTVPAAGSPVTVTDAFSLSTTGGFTREDLVSLALGPVASISVDANANASPDETNATGLLTQTWLASLSLTPFPPFGISSSLALSQALTGYALARDWYGARWAEEAALLLPWKGGEAGYVTDVSRTEKLDLRAGIPAAPFGFALDAETSAGGSAYTSIGFSQVSALSLGLSFLLKLGPGDSADSLGVSYRRSLSVTTAPGWGPRFQQETSELARILALQGYFLQGIPLVEIFSDNTGAVLPGWQTATQGTYSPTVTLSFQRSYGSRLTDLLIPSAVDLAVGQELDKTTDLVQTVTYVRPKISTRAVNLFGQLGSVPRLPMVQTDEYSFSVSASVDHTTPSLYPQYGPGPLLSQLSVQAYAALVAADSSQLTLVETLRRDQAASVVLSSDAQALLEWRVTPSAGIPLPLLPPDIGATGRFEHRESAEVTVGYQDAGAFHPFALVLGHSTSLVYPGHGSIKASVDLGMDVEDLLASGLAWRFAARASIEAKLTF
jgi:hypothetical protein